MNYGQLKTAVNSFLNHGAATSSVATFVQLAEAVIRRDVRVPALESKVTGTLSGGVLTLPDDFLEARRLVVSGYPCDYVSADAYQVFETDGATYRKFTRIGNTMQVLGGGSGAYSLLYSGAFDALSSDTDTNWLLTNAADVYLFKALTYAAAFVKDAVAAQGYEALYQAAKDAVNLKAGLDRYSGSPLSMNVGSPA
jgi:hypothetical protein